MSEAFRTLTYDQSAFPFASCAAFLRKRSVPKYLSICCLIALIVMLGPMLLASLPPRGNAYSAQSVPFVCFSVGWLAYTSINKSFLRTYYRGIANSGYRSGPRQLELTSNAVTITSPNSRWQYPWPHIVDVIAGPQGTVMILLSPFEYEPVSATAFSDSDERDSFIAMAQTLRVAKGKSVP